ncbi:MAG: nucleotidyltransferase domain-containing protein [Acetobacter okinawensis]
MTLSPLPIFFILAAIGIAMRGQQKNIASKTKLAFSTPMRSQGLFIAMISGLTIEKIRMEIRSTVESLPFVQAVWGFGSYFRRETSRDIDLLVIVNCPIDELLHNTKTLRHAIAKLEDTFDQPIDLLIVTPTEFFERPLRDMDQLVMVYLADEK